MRLRQPLAAAFLGQFDVFGSSVLIREDRALLVVRRAVLDDAAAAQDGYRAEVAGAPFADFGAFSRVAGGFPLVAYSGTVTDERAVLTHVDSRVVMGKRAQRVHPNEAFVVALGVILGDLGLTQQELAKKAGVSENTMWRWRSGRFRPSRPVQQQLLDAVARAPKEHVHALARSMLDDPSVTYAEGSATLVPTRMTPARHAATEHALATIVQAWAARLGLPQDTVRLVLDDVLRSVVRLDIDAATARWMLHSSKARRR